MDNKDSKISEKNSPHLYGVNTNYDTTSSSKFGDVNDSSQGKSIPKGDGTFVTVSGTYRYQAGNVDRKEYK